MPPNTNLEGIRIDPMRIKITSLSPSPDKQGGSLDLETRAKTTTVLVKNHSFL